MTERITAEQFHEAEGVDDWRVLAFGASAHFRTGSFGAGMMLLERIGVLADGVNHHPDVDLRYGHLTVRLFTHELPGLSDRDLALARDISAAARDLGIEADAEAVQDVGLTLDALDKPAVLAFWQALLGYEPMGDDDLVDPLGRWPSIYVQQLDQPRPQRNRIHVDVFVPHDHAEARIAAALAAGGQLLSDEHAPAWWTLADPEGNEADVATSTGRS